MRDDSILQSKLEHIWNHHFSDITQANQIHIKFGRKAKKRLGSIRECIHFRKNNETIILLNGHFKDKKIPEFILDATIAHELCHYIHGFGSTMPKKVKYPHRGGVVDKEIKERGLSDLVKKEKKWLDKNWFPYLDQQN